MRKASPRLAVTFVEWAYPERFDASWTQTGTRLRRNGRKFAVKPKKRTFDQRSSRFSVAVERLLCRNFGLRYLKAHLDSTPTLNDEGCIHTRGNGKLR